MNNEQLHQLKRNRTVPIFDCVYEEFDQHLEFYTALGFEISYYQKSPYRYASVRSDFTEIGFFGDKKLVIDNAHRGGGCYIVVPDIKEVHTRLKANLKQYYGKIPTSGLPRFSKLNQTAEDMRCNITDPSGNTLIIGEPLGNSTEMIKTQEERVKAMSKFEKLYTQSYRFAYSKEDFLAARHLLESAFASHSANLSDELYFKAKVLQIDIYSSLGQVDKAREILAELDAFAMTDEQQDELVQAMERYTELKNELSG